jgi:hypothetical protein
VPDAGFRPFRRMYCSSFYDAYLGANVDFNLTLEVTNIVTLMSSLDASKPRDFGPNALRSSGLLRFVPQQNNYTFYRFLQVQLRAKNDSKSKLLTHVCICTAVRRTRSLFGSDSGLRMWRCARLCTTAR